MRSYGSWDSGSRDQPQHLEKFGTFSSKTSRQLTGATGGKILGGFTVNWFTQSIFAAIQHNK